MCTKIEKVYKLYTVQYLHLFIDLEGTNSNIVEQFRDTRAVQIVLNGNKNTNSHKTRKRPELLISSMEARQDLVDLLFHTDAQLHSTQKTIK